jgi:peptide/nickel transport system substrate-binding protein
LGKSTALAALIAIAAMGTAFAQNARTLTIAFANNVNTYDPHMTATIGTDMSLLAHLYAALVTRGPDLQLRPQVATAWTAVDQTTWRITLRTGVTFANGEKLDAAAVKWNIDRVRDPAVNARIRAWFELVQDVRVISDTEVEIKTSQPYPALIDQLTMFLLLPPQWTAQNNPAAATMPSGAYEVREIRPGDRITLAARAGYWGDAPAFETVVFRIVPEASSRIAALMAGEVDLITGVPPSEFERINRGNRARAGSVDSTRTFFVRYNNLIAPMQNNRNLRLALNYAIDKQAIVDTILGGLGRVANCGILTPAYFGFNQELRPIPYDPARARQLLREAGITGPITIDFDVPTGVYLLSQEITQAIAAQLEEVGIRARINEMEFGAYMNKYLRARALAPMAYISLAWPTLDGDGLLSFFETGNIYAYWEDEPFTTLLRQSRLAPNADERRRLLQQAAARLCEESPSLWLFTQPATYGLSNRVTWQARGDDWILARDFAPR